VTDVLTTRGAILWFDRDSGDGALQTDEGRFLRFVARRFPFQPAPGRLVEVELDPRARTLTEQVVVRPLRERLEVRVEDVVVHSALHGGGVVGAARPAGVEAPRLVAVEVPDGSAPRRRGKPKGYPKKKPGEGFAVGSSVLHPQHGQGFVIMSTLRVARIKFASQDRTVRVADLTPLDDG
jgi:hypothetical protein